MKLSLILATAGRINEIHTLLDSLERQTSKAFELIVVDQNETGYLGPILKRLSDSSICYRHVPCPRRGLSIARNVGLTHAANAIVGYPDDDCWYEPEVVQRVLEAFSNSEDLQGVVTCWWEQDGDRYGPRRLDAKQWRTFRKGISAFSSCLFFRRDLVAQLGGFDELLGVPQWFGAAEEIDLTLRALETGAIMEYRPDIRVHHPVKTIYQEPLIDAIRRARQRSCGTGALYRKHRLHVWVVLRGLFSPLVKSLFPPYSLRRLLVNVATAWGRLEGMIAWRNHTHRQAGMKQIGEPSDR